MIKKIILYVTFIAIFLFALFKLTGYVIGANATPADILSGRATEITISSDQYNHNKNIFCVSNSGNHRYIDGSKYKVKQLISITGNTARKNNKTSTAACYQKFIYAVWWTQENEHSGRFSKAPNNNDSSWGMGNISAAQYIIWRRVFVNVQDNLKKDGLIGAGAVIGENLNTNGDISSGPTANRVWNQANNLDTSGASVSISFAGANSVSVHNVGGTIYYYFPFTIQKSGKVTSTSRTFYPSAGSNNGVSTGNIGNGTYYVRFTEGEIANGSYRNNITVNVQGGFTYSGELAILSTDGDSQNLILARGRRTRNTASKSAQPPQISPATITITKKDSQSGGNLSAGFYVKFQDGRWLASNGTLSNNKSEIWTSSSGTVTIRNII